MRARREPARNPANRPAVPLAVTHTRTSARAHTQRTHRARARARAHVMVLAGATAAAVANRAMPATPGCEAVDEIVCNGCACAEGNFCRSRLVRYPLFVWVWGCGTMPADSPYARGGPLASSKDDRCHCACYCGEEEARPLTAAFQNHALAAAGVDGTDKTDNASEEAPAAQEMTKDGGDTGTEPDAAPAEEADKVDKKDSKKKKKKRGKK